MSEFDDEPYVCHLDEATQRKAFKELNEDPKNRQGAIDTFREWVLEQKHLKCPTDNVFLLAFLRARYFSQLQARQLLENYLKMRTKLSAWTQNLDIGSTESIESVKTGACLILPGRDEHGRKVYMIRPGYAHQMKNFKKEHSFRMLFTIMDYLYFSDEMNQVHGTVSVADHAKLTLAHHKSIPMEDRRKMMQAWQSNYPVRLKGMHFYNMGALMDIIIPFMKLTMIEKLQKRIVVHGKNLESVYKYVPKAILPDEYLADDHNGPSGGSEQSIIDSMVAEFSKPEVRERSRNISSREFTINMKEKDKAVPQASFRKLSTD